MTLPALLLAVALAALAWFRRGRLPLPLRWRDRGGRARRLYRNAAKQWLCFAVLTVIGLALLGRLDAVATMPAEFRPAAALLGPVAITGDAGATAALLGGLAGGAALGALLSMWLQRRGRRAPWLGDLTAVMPRTRDELGAGAVAAISAGVTEELFFRLFLPLLITLVTGQPLIGFTVATLLFGYAHSYQGVVGVVATTVAGTLLAVLYLWSGSLWLTIAAHVVIDLNGLVLRPALTGAWRKAGVSSSAASRS